jgi:TetR/AcrR family transcriptional repressor of nem operon
MTREMMPRPREFDEEQALDSAMELFWAKGYEGTSLSDLEAALGVGRQSLYNVFGDKRQLFLASLDRYRRQASEALVALASGGAGIDAIREYFHASLELLAGPEARRGCFVARSLVDHGQHDPDVARRCNVTNHNVQESLTTALRTARARGEIGRDVPIEATARALTAQLSGLSVLARGDATKAELKDAVDAFLDRLKPRT